QFGVYANGIQSNDPMLTQFVYVGRSFFMHNARVERNPALNQKVDDTHHLLFGETKGRRS
ncbi:MAG: hypothetical protein Q9M12_01820, partial [Mariprofundus sp.]|nr:hypothetical protein [Mariprofundus sp.]